MPPKQPSSILVLCDSFKWTCLLLSNEHITFTYSERQRSEQLTVTAPNIQDCSLNDWAPINLNNIVTRNSYEFGKIFWLSLNNQPFPFQVREPAEVISDDVVIFTPRTSYDHHTFVVGVFGYLLLGPGGANLQQQQKEMHRYASYMSHQHFLGLETTNAMSIEELCKQKHLARVN